MKSVLFGVIIFFLWPIYVLAAVPDVYTNENFLSSEHDAPVSLFVLETGGFYGYTQTGKLYRQIPIENNLGVRIHKFSIDEAYFYITDKGTIFANDDLAAISKYFIGV